MFLLSEKSTQERVEVKRPAARRILTARTEVGGVELLERIAEEARSLCREANASEPFYMPDWSEAYIRAFNPQGELILFTVWEGERIRAYLPLMLTSGFVSGLPVRKLTSCASQFACRFDLVCCTGDEREEVLRGIWREMSRLRKWDVLELLYVKEGSAIDELLQLASKEGYSVARKLTWRALYATFQKQPDGTEPCLAHTQRKFRANLRRTRKELDGLGSVAFQHHSSADPEALARFFQLEASGWKGREGTAISCEPARRLFFELVATAASRDGYFSLDFLELDGKPIAGHFSLVWNGRYQLLKAAYDESYSRLGPGHLIVLEAFRNLGPSGLRELDFIASPKWDETRWASEGRDHYTWFAFSRTPYGGLLHFLRISGRSAIKSLLRSFSKKQNPVKSN